jgi:hypothetical protein
MSVSPIALRSTGQEADDVVGESVRLLDLGVMSGAGDLCKARSGN